MQQKHLITFLCSLTCFLLVLIQTGIGKEKQTITIAILPCSDVVKTFERFEPMIAKLESDTRFKVQAVFPKNENELISLFSKGNVDFVFHSPYGFQQIKNLIDPQTLLKALGPEGLDYEVGYLAVRKDSGIRTIQDLRGKTVLFGMECSASRWIVARKLFHAHGIDIDKDLGSYTDGGCCEDISYNIFLKAGDAGLICQHYFDEQKLLKAKHIEALAVIAESQPSPTRIFAAHKETPRKIIDRVYKSLRTIDLNDPKYTSLISTTEIGGFVPASPDEYDSLDDI